MASIQERLQLKRVPLDKWSTKEKLCLASAVACSGDQNWMSVSRALKMLCGANRPGDWFSQKSCAAQYGKLLENVETPKRKKRTASERDGVAAVETPGESILRKLTQERIIELKKIIQEEAQQYTKVKEDIILIQSGVTDETKLREMWKQIQMEKAQKEKEQILHAQWLKEREEKKLELERQWRPLFPSSPNSSKTQGSCVKIKEEMDEDSQSSSKSGTSPLLTSLLKSPSANPSGSPALPTTGSSRSAASPTITNLLTVTGNDASQQLGGCQSSLQEGTKLGIGDSSAYQVAPKLTKLLDNSTENKASVLVAAQESQEIAESAVKSEDMDTDSDNVDPAKDLMAVFQELMPEELDEILNENDGMILEDEILENVVDSIMEEEEDEAPLKGKDLDALEEANIANSSIAEGQDDDRIATSSKNEESTPEVAKGAYLKPAAAAPSPQRHTVFEEDPVKAEEIASAATVNVSEKEDDAQENATEGNLILPMQEESMEKGSEPAMSKDQESEIIPVEDSSSSSPSTNPSSVENKQKHETVGSDAVKIEDETTTIKAEPEDDSSDKLLASLDTSSFDTKATTVNSAEKMEIKQEEAEDSESGTSDNKSIPLIVEDKPQQDAKVLTSEEEAARAKKEALEKLAAEYDFKDDEEPIVPLSIQKSKEEKHAPDEDVYMDAQEHLDETEGSKETEQKKQDDTVVTVTDTDDDSLIEMKISKTKRDYSRRRTVDELCKPKDDLVSTPKNEESEGRTLRKLRDRDRSESPFVLLDDDVSDKMKRSYSSTPVMDSIPSSPASSEDRDYRAWKKSILSIHSRISSLRQASAFLKPLTDEQISDIIYRPMDLSTIKKNIENGTIRTTAEYQRDVMLIYTNALILNQDEPCCPKAAHFLMTECVVLIETTMETGRTHREKDAEGRGGSANKRSSRKGTTRTSTSAARN